MFSTNIRIEAPSDRPSLLQSLFNAFTTAMEMACFAFSVFTPYHLTHAMYRLNRNMSQAWGVR